MVDSIRSAHFCLLALMALLLYIDRLDQYKCVQHSIGRWRKLYRLLGSCQCRCSHGTIERSTRKSLANYIHWSTANSVQYAQHSCACNDAYHFVGFVLRAFSLCTALARATVTIRPHSTFSRFPIVRISLRSHFDRRPDLRMAFQALVSVAVQNKRNRIKN